MSARLFKTFLLLLLVAGNVMAADLPAARPESVGLSSERLARLTAGMKGFVDSKKLSGVVTMVAKDGKIVHTEVAGQRDIATGAPMKRDTIFRIYSMTKPITGVAMMILHEEGKWQLNEPVSKYIPEFENLKVAKVDPVTGTIKQVQPDHPMTMLELLAHTSGLSYGSGESAVDKMYKDAKVMDSEQPLQSMIDKLAKIPLLFQPGERWHYSIAVDVQGYLVEKLSGQSLGDFLKSRIFDPLKMKDTAFYVPAEKANRLAVFYTYDEQGGLVPKSDALSYSAPPVFQSGGGGLFSTIDDYMRFCQMLLNGGRLDGQRLLSPVTVKAMRTNVLPGSTQTMPSGVFALDAAPRGIGFGLDFAVIENPVTAGGYGGEGTYYWMGYAGTWFWIDPVYNLIVVGMIQHVGKGMPSVGALSRTLTYQAIQ